MTPNERLWQVSYPPVRLLPFVAVLAMVCALVPLAGTAHATEPIRPMQWYLDSWKIEEAWQLSRGAGVTVAVIDTGVNADHADLKGQVLPAAKEGDIDINGKGHGTSMAALIAGTGKGVGGQGVYGIAPEAKILPYQVPLELGPLSFDPLVDAINAAAESSAQIINLSLGEGDSAPYVAKAIARAQSRGKLVIAGAGNRETPVGNRVYPAAYPGVLGVSAFDRTGTFWSGSYQGDWVSISAPGVDIVSACNGPTGYCKGSGTSNSTALASGVAALLWSKHPDWTANQVIKVLIDSANKPSNGSGLDNMLGYGGISPRRALGWTGDPGPPDVNPLVGKRGDPPATAPAPSAAPSSTAPPMASAAPAPAVSADPAQAASGSRGGGVNYFIVVGAIVGGVVVLAVLAVSVLRNRRRRPPPGAPGAPSSAFNTPPPAS